MAEIDILLAAYNGEKFIAEQLDSLIAQTFKDFRIIIRDDGSNDNTPAIIQDYAEKYPGIIEVVHDDVICRNPAKNFFELMKHANADYVMFSDQDDFWLENKIQITLECMKNAEKNNPGMPVLVFTGLQPADANLNAINEFVPMDINARKYYSLVSMFEENFVSGCTEMINKSLYKNIGEYDALITMHDWWTALYARACGVIAYVPEATMLYRQHGHNAIGYSERTVMLRLKKLMCAPLSKIRKAGKLFHELHERVLLFRSRYADKMMPEKLKQLDNFIMIFTGNRFRRLSFMRKLDYSEHHNLIENIFLAVKVLMY
ncbi:MAG: glycosyltransferase family 2 protein [Synergistaceae bacterium]|nr:glycosyltransferase family 2 protein [Synergistaceae bacterium]